MLLVLPPNVETALRTKYGHAVGTSDAGGNDDDDDDDGAWGTLCCATSHDDADASADANAGKSVVIWVRRNGCPSLAPRAPPPLRQTKCTVPRVLKDFLTPRVRANGSDRYCNVYPAASPSGTYLVKVSHLGKQVLIARVRDQYRGALLVAAVAVDPTLKEPGKGKEWYNTVLADASKAEAWLATLPGE